MTVMTVAAIGALATDCNEGGTYDKLRERKKVTTKMSGRVDQTRRHTQHNLNKTIVI